MNYELRFLFGFASAILPPPLLGEPVPPKAGGIGGRYKWEVTLI